MIILAFIGKIFYWIALAAWTMLLYGFLAMWWLLLLPFKIIAYPIYWALR